MITFDTILIIALIIAVGMIFGKLAELVKIPAITGYIIAGVLLGPSVLGETLLSSIGLPITESVVDGLDIISSIALGFIAYGIGTELWLPKLKKSGKQIIVITLFQAITAVVVTFVSVLIFREIWLSLVLGAIATATAPAPIMMIVKRYRAKGEVTDTLVPVVGIDDAVGIVVFGICIALATSLLNGSEGGGSIGDAILGSLKELGLSVLIGVIIGLAIGLISHIIDKYSSEQRTEAHQIVSIVAIFVAVALANKFDASNILTPMFVGFTFTNMINKETYRVNTKSVDMFTPSIMIIFFAIAGAKLDLTVFKDVMVIVIALVYLVARSIGKIGGAYLGCMVCRTSSNIKKHLGIALLPQGGVEIGLVMSVVSTFNASGHNEEAAKIQAIVLAAILVYELFTPFLVKKSLESAGEIRFQGIKNIHKAEKGVIREILADSNMQNVQNSDKSINDDNNDEQ